MKSKAVVFENDIATINLLAENLEKLGFEVITVSGGLEGLEAIFNNKPQLIFLNTAMADVSNYQVCKLLKNKTECRHIPIVILSNKPKDRLKFWSIKMGADSYLIKPLDKERINLQLKDLIGRFSEDIAFNSFQSKIEEFNEIIRNLAQTCHKDPYLSSPMMQLLLQQLIEVITTILKSERGSLMLVDKNANVLIIKAAIGLNQDIIANTRVRFGEGICGWVVKQNHPLFVSNIEKDERFYKESSDRYYTKSLLSIPVKFAEARGVININNKADRQDYNTEDLNLLLLLINQISFVFECCDFHRRFEETEVKLKKAEKTGSILIEANRLLDKELYETTISDEVNKIVTADLDYHQTVNAVIEIVEQLVDFHFCGLLLIDEDGQGELIISIKYPTAESEVESFKLKTIESFNELTHKVISNSEVILNRTGDPAVIAGDSGQTGIVNSFQAQLLHNADRVIGLLAVSHSRKDAFSEEDLKSFSIVAQRSIPAINNAALHRKIKELSNRDGLTGVYNYRSMQDHLDRELKRAERYQEPFGIIMLDIDGFKSINDTCGHPQGDVVLRELSSILVNICRNVDIIARCGGEEFLIILPKTDRDGTFYLAERMRRIIKNYDFSSTGDEPIKLTVSLGVVSYPTSATSKAELLKKVDAALYQAKREGKNVTIQI